MDLWVAAPGGGSRCCQLCGEGLLVPSRVDHHVVYAVGDGEVDNRSLSRGGCQGTPAKETQPVDDRLKEERCQLIVRRGICT